MLSIDTIPNNILYTAHQEKIMVTFVFLYFMSYEENYFYIIRDNIYGAEANL
jgi:hypothetical protein